MLSKEYYQSIKNQSELLKEKILNETNIDTMSGGLFSFLNIVDYVTTKYDIVQIPQEQSYEVISYKTGLKDVPFYGKKMYVQIQGLNKITIGEKEYQELIRVEWLNLIQMHFKLKQKKMDIFPLELYCISPALIKRVVLAEDKEVDSLIDRYRYEKHWLKRTGVNKVSDPMNYEYQIFVATPEYISHLLDKNPENGISNIYELHGCIILKPSFDFNTQNHFIHNQ